MKNYTPSNSTDGEMFMCEYCYKCYKYKQCTILTSAFFGKQVKQWIYDENESPICTSFNPNRPKRNKKIIDNKPKLF